MDAEVIQPRRRVPRDAIAVHSRAVPPGHEQASNGPKTVMSHCACYKNALLQPIAYQRARERDAINDRYSWRLHAIHRWSVAFVQNKRGMQANDCRQKQHPFLKLMFEMYRRNLLPF